MEASGSNSSSKKRKFCHKEDEDREQEDEAKMETFFALVRSFQETRDRWINLRSGDHHRKNKRVSKNIAGKDEENRVAAWKPTFQLEDFAEEKAEQCQNPDHPSLALLAGASRSNNCAKEEDAENGIDLTLSL